MKNMINSRAFNHLKIIILFVWHAMVIEMANGTMLYKVPVFRSFVLNNNVDSWYEIWNNVIILYNHNTQYLCPCFYNIRVKATDIHHMFCGCIKYHNISFIPIILCIMSLTLLPRCCIFEEWVSRKNNRTNVYSAFSL